MTNPTSNFGWPMPTATDLVTDLPADFEVFGQAVDTDLAGLNGGTTGQVLSKTSGTDLAFTWVDTDDTNAIQNAIVTAKGDLIGASASATPVVLAVGADGTQLVADSAEATGLKWAAAAAGGKVLQVVYGSTTAATSNSTSTYADTTLTATITPSLISSEVLVLVSQNGLLKSDAASGNRMQIQLLRGATQIAVAGAILYNTTASALFNSGYSVSVLDSPATTSATTYKTQFNNEQNAASVTVQDGSATSTIVLLEIGA